MFGKKRVLIATVIFFIVLGNVLSSGKTALAQVSKFSAGTSSTLDGGASTTSSPYALCQVVVDFNSSMTASVSDILSQKKPFPLETNGVAQLDSVRRKYNLTKADGVFINRTGVDTATAQQVRFAQIAERDARFPFLRERAQKQAAFFSRTSTVSDVTNYYLVYTACTVEPSTVCNDLLLSAYVGSCQPNYFYKEADWVPNDSYYFNQTTGQPSVGAWGQSYPDLWNLWQIEAGAAWDSSRGTGVVVAVVDGGVDYNHLDISGNIWQNPGEIGNDGVDNGDANTLVDDIRGWDFVQNDNRPFDERGHGTHVAGIIAAVGDNQEGIIGVAPESEIMITRAIDSSGNATATRLAASIDYATLSGASVINNSWICKSSGCTSGGLGIISTAVTNAFNAGVVVVVAAGNDSENVSTRIPQNMNTEVIVVTATTESDTSANYSNFGSTIDLAAPGGGTGQISCSQSGFDIADENILSLRAFREDGSGTDRLHASCPSLPGSVIVGQNYYRMRGTSMSAPHVSGAAALLLAANPELAPFQIEQILRDTADNIVIAGEDPLTGFDPYTGYGRLNARQAVDEATRVVGLITNPSAEANIEYEDDSFELRGTAAGYGFQQYHIRYQRLQLAGELVPQIYNFGHSSESVENGLLATINVPSDDRGEDVIITLVIRDIFGVEHEVDSVVVHFNSAGQGGGPCFLAGTPILLADGKTKLIEDISVGDVVLAYDEETKTFKPDAVKHFVVGYSKVGYLIVNDEMKVTPAHRLLVNGKWVEAGNLAVGDQLLDTSGKARPVTSIKRVEDPTVVFNFDVNPYNTYVAHGVVVHNYDLFSYGDDNFGRK